VTRCRLEKIASVTANLRLDGNAVLGTDVPARAGTVVAARVLNAKTTYNRLEDVHGRLVALQPGDVIAGALGHRDALYGYSGRVPESVSVGDELQLLNQGGVIGAGAEAAPGIGEPYQLEILGSVLAFPHLDRRVGRPANIADAAHPARELPANGPPLLVLVGTSMDAGKTTAAGVVIADLVRRGKSVAAGKLTGVSLRRDALQMADCGASPSLVFTDFGIVTTDERNAVPAAHSLVAALDEAEPDAIVLEMGDGLLGTYGVHALLDDPALRGRIAGTLLCAQDPVGAWGGARILSERYDLAPTAVSGRVTDTPAGRRFCTERLGVPGWNALLHGPELCAALGEALGASRSAPQAVTT
jgi:hypothetical protein